MNFKIKVKCYDHSKSSPWVTTYKPGNEYFRGWKIENIKAYLEEIHKRDNYKKVEFSIETC